ncbi:RAMP superfamily CRISPR-associated protein [Microcoleus sp. BROC3]|uniref:RAMP superfamily CRISPR-associated protein n=1 Tax=Microcoleus sp. BROC3 TaxID=3055323 RepID=UPI002FD1DADC
MHKRFVNHCTIDLTLIPDGPILIKSGKEGADPTKPDMEFVETYHAGGKSIYLPGSSLKGAIRAHAERIVRTVGTDKRPTNGDSLWASNPLNRDELKYLDSISDSQDIYRLSSFTDQMFGNTSIASRVRIQDAHPIDKKQLKIQERNGVAIDRVFGSVAVGPFNYQVCTAGEFRTKIHLKNFSLAQLGLIGLVLRDLNDGWFGIGFAKSRGLGTVTVKYNEAVVQYPGCQLDRDNRQIQQILKPGRWGQAFLLGAGEFLDTEEAANYGFSKPDREQTPIPAEPMDLGFGVQLKWQGDGETGVPNLFKCAVRGWSEFLRGAAA